jgi:hypothetical protein
VEQTSGPAKAPAEAVAKDIWPGEGSLPVPLPPPSRPSTTFSAAVRRAEKPRITKGFRPKLWTARRAEWGETFSVWPFVSEALYCARSVRVWESVAGQGFACGVAGGEFARAFAWSRGADLQIEGTGRS